MSAHKHDVESSGAKPRDHQHPRHHVMKHLHESRTVQLVVVLMLVLIMVYVFTKDLSIWPGHRSSQPIPAANAP
jgi:hypothetical protein